MSETSATEEAPAAPPAAPSTPPTGSYAPPTGSYAPPAGSYPPAAGSYPPPAAPPRRLTRVRDGKVLGGVCTGLARHFDIDVVLVRVGFVLVALFTGVGFLAYPALWIVMPRDPAA